MEYMPTHDKFRGQFRSKVLDRTYLKLFDLKGPTKRFPLNERDGGVDNQKNNDNNEVLPIRRLATTIG
jgi:hypothetical protein